MIDLRNGSRHNLVSVNLLGTIEQASTGAGAVRIDADGRPYVPVGDGGVVLGVRLGHRVFDYDGDHLAPGACVVNSDANAGYALVAQSCIGNAVEVRTGAALGARGAVAGKRGERSQVVVVFEQEVLRALRPGDAVTVRTRGQGAEEPIAGVTLVNVEPELLGHLPISVRSDHLEIGVRGTVPCRVVGNGIGRPTPMWDVDLQISASSAHRWGADHLALGDLVAIDDLDARWNAGYRRGWRSVGLVVHGGSPQPGHGPGVTVVLTGPADRLRPRAQPDGHGGLREQPLLEFAAKAPDRTRRDGRSSGSPPGDGLPPHGHTEEGNP